MNFKKIEKAWQNKWEKKKVFESKLNKKKKFLTSIVIPYVNGDIHIGHSFTYSRTDAYARFMRMKGCNVLLAQGFHATGEPILGTIERLRKGDKNQIETFRTFGLTDHELELFKKNGAEYAARYWSKKIKKTAIKMGFSVDWRRTFVTAIEPTFNRFIEWQYNTLKKKGYVTQGTHPVIWCPHCHSPTGDHDRLEGEGESPVDYILLKFKLGDDYLPAGTLRPETIYGVTNMWINPSSHYVRARIDDEKWIISKEASEKLKDQLKRVEIVEDVDVNKLLGKRCINPVSNQEIPILPSVFVDPNSATGIVMSVPSHAPYDWIAIREFLGNNNPEKYGITKSELEPVPLIKTEGLGEFPAIEICEKMGITSLKQQKELDEATGIIYKKEYHLGTLNERCGEYSGLKVSECKEKLSKYFIDKGVADAMWETTGKVVCRCTTPNHVKILENQWFLKFSDEEWKKMARRCLAGMTIYPDEARNNFENTIEWLKDKACTRKTGLGTPLPWDKSWIVETLSDSTIYMAYYTIARIVNEKKIPARKLTDEVFDYIFLNKGILKTVSKNSKLNAKIINEMKNEFEYFYPVDFRNSGKDLIQNHLTFFIFHHVAIFPEKNWPRAISVNGFVNVEGEKMSKSKGNIIPLKMLVDTYGADLTRINIINSAEGLEDADWHAENIKGIRSRLETIYDTACSMKYAKNMKARNSDLYLHSRLQKIVSAASVNIEQARFRTAIQYALFDATSTLKWYIRRVGGIKNANKKALANYISSICRLLAPITPHLCEEIWHNLGNKGFVSLAPWPVADKSLINEESEIAENFLTNIIDDVEEIRRITQKDTRVISIFVANDWKFKIYEIVLKSKGKDINSITKEIMSTDMKRYGNATVAFIQSLYKKKNELKTILDRKTQAEFLNESTGFLEKELGCKIKILDAEKSDDSKDASGVSQVKARASTPQKPGILLE